MVQPFRLTDLVKEGGEVATPSLNLNYSLSDFLLIVNLKTHPMSTRIQFKSCLYL